MVVGEIGAFPTKPTLPIPWSIVTEVALDTLQLSVAVLPLVIAGGLALNEIMLGKLAGLGVGVGVGVGEGVGVGIPETTT